MSKQTRMGRCMCNVLPGGSRLEQARQRRSVTSAAPVKLNTITLPLVVAESLTALQVQMKTKQE